MPKEITTAAIVYRPRKPEAKKRAKELAQYLKKKGVEAYSHPKQDPLTGTKKLTATSLKKLGLVIVLGGDGTYLNAVRMLNGQPIPVLGINLGSLGFLTQTRKEKLKSVVNQALQSKLQMRQRTMLEVIIKRGGKNHARYLALNDIVIERGPVSRLIYLSIHSEGTLVSDLKADGLIVATPTGSTAYNLAAGGPILHPEVPAIVITPICPHSLTSRPITLADNQNIQLRMTAEMQSAVFMVDGQREADLTPNDTILIRKAREKHNLLVDPSHNYFDVLRAKLQFGERS